MIDRGDFIRSLAAAVASPACPTSGTRPYNVLILGDSISWGQGLKNTQRWRTLLHDNLERELQRCVTVYSPEIHSGAVIGIGDRDEIGFKGMYQPDAPADRGERSRLGDDFGEFGGELPFPTPTILRQLDTFRDKFNRPELTIDLVVISAGINDVSVTRFLNPARAKDDVATLIRTHCRFHLTALLDRVRTLVIGHNDKCRVIVLSYFPILSSDSRPPLSEFIAAALGGPHDVKTRHDAKNLSREAGSQPSSTQPSSPQSALVRSFAVAAERFFSESDTAIGSAVDDANRDTGDDEHPEHFRQHFYHVRPAFDQTHAAYTSAPWLWELRVVDNPLHIGDSVADDRKRACAKIVPPQSATDTAICENAAIGHPNVEGANHGYFDAIWAQVKEFVHDAAP